MWIDFISCLDNMWDISDFADEIQQIWDHTFPELEHVISKNKDAVYKVVSDFLVLIGWTSLINFIQLMQHGYDYRSDFGERAEIVVGKYIQTQKWLPEEIRHAVAYVAPEQAQVVDDTGRTVLVNPPIYPYMWKLVIGDETNVEVSVPIQLEPDLL
jgi:hypothetical protein